VSKKIAYLGAYRSASSGIFLVPTMIMLSPRIFLPRCVALSEERHVAEKRPV